MRELKVYHCNEWHNEYTEFYLKSEADKVIEELKSDIADLRDDKKSTDAIIDERNVEIAKLEARIADGDKDFEMADHQNERLLKIVRHQKYKRCLAMAKWCMTEYIQSKCLDFTNTEQWYWRRWHIRWRKLANKFKEAK